MQDNRVLIGERLRACRKAKGLTQDELSAILDISVKHYSEVERGIAGLSMENWILVSDILNASLDYLLKGVTMDTAILLSSLFYNTNDKQKATLVKIIDLVKEYNKE